MLKFDKIIGTTKDKLYIKFSNGEIKILNQKDFLKDKPDWQIDIVKKNWRKVKIDKYGDLVFSVKFDVGADTVIKKCKNISKKELLNIIEFISLL